MWPQVATLVYIFFSGSIIDPSFIDLNKLNYLPVVYNFRSDVDVVKNCFSGLPNLCY